MSIGFNRNSNTKHGQEVLASMTEDALIIETPQLCITQKMHALKMFVFPRTAYRTRCADLSHSPFES
jgi:hypothetical protein